MCVTQCFALLYPDQVTSTVLGRDGVTEEPVLASLAVVAGRVLQTLLAEAAEPVASVGVAHVDVVVALAGLAEIAWNEKSFFMIAVTMQRLNTFGHLQWTDFTLELL